MRLTSTFSCHCLVNSLCYIGVTLLHGISHFEVNTNHLLQLTIPLFISQITYYSYMMFIGSWSLSKLLRHRRLLLRHGELLLRHRELLLRLERLRHRKYGRHRRFTCHLSTNIGSCHRLTHIRRNRLAILKGINNFLHAFLCAQFDFSEVIRLIFCINNNIQIL